MGVKLCVCAGEEELHGKLEEDRFLFSQENDSAACDVLDLREVISIFDCSNGYCNLMILALWEKTHVFMI